MTEPPPQRTVLMVDEDLGFLLWLGQLFAEIGYRSVPASSCRQAASHLKKLKVNISLVVVNQGLKGARSLLKTLEGDANRIRIILIRNPTATAFVAVPESAILDKPRAWENIARAEWLQRLRQALADAPPLAAAAAAAGSSSQTRLQ